MEKHAVLSRAPVTLATQPVIPSVIMLCAPARLLAATRPITLPAGVAGPSAMLSKYQSLPRLLALACQL